MVCYPMSRQRFVNIALTSRAGTGSDQAHQHGTEYKCGGWQIVHAGQQTDGGFGGQAGSSLQDGHG